MYKITLYEYGKAGEYTLLDIPNSIVNIESGNINYQQDNVDSLSLTINHQFLVQNNIKLRPFKTLVKVRDLKRNKIIFKGRVLVPEESIDINGKITHSATFEGKQAYLHDTTQKYSFEFDKMPVDNLRLLIDYHNTQVATEPYKKFIIGNCNVPKNVIEQDGEYREEEKYFKRWDDKDTFESIESDLIGKYEGHILIEYAEDDTQDKIHYLTEIGNKKTTKIKIGHNLQTFQYKVDPTEIITRVKPLGQSSETANGDEIRLTIADVNGGIEYIDIPELIALYGIQVGAVDFDAYAPITLKEKTLKWIDEQRKKVAKMSITLDALDLSLIGIDTDLLEMYGIYTTEVEQLNVIEDLKIIGLDIDVLNPQSKSVTIGEKELSYEEIQSKYYNDIAINVVNNIAPTIINNSINDVLKTEIPGMIDDAVGDVESRLETSIDDKIDDFENMTFNPYKATVSELMNAKISDFKNYSLGTIIENTIDSNKTEIKDSVVNSINSSTNVIKAQALVVDSAMIDKLMANDLLTNRLVSNNAYITNLMASYIVSEKIKTTSIDLNRATISGTVDVDNYIILSNDYIKQYGKYTSTNESGYQEEVKGYTELKNGILRIRNDSRNRSIYIHQNGITTNFTSPLSANSTLQFNSSYPGETGTGPSLTSYGGPVNIQSYQGLLNLQGKKVDLYSEGSLTLTARDVIQCNTPIKASNFIGALKNDVGNVYVMTNDEARITTTAGYNGGNPVYRPIKASNITQTSHEKYKTDINKWNDSILDFYKEKIQLYSWKYKTESESDKLHHGIIIREDETKDQFPKTWRSDDSVSVGEVSFWNTKAIQELISKIDKLEEQINGTT